MKATTNAKVVRAEGLPEELLKLGLQYGGTILLKRHQRTILIWREGKVLQQKKDAIINRLIHTTGGTFNMPTSYQ